MSVKLNLFNDIKTALLSAGAQRVLLYNNQFAQERKEFVYEYKTVLVEFRSIPWTNTNQKTTQALENGNCIKSQKADNTIIVLHIGYNTGKEATDSFEELDAYLQLVYFAVQELTGTYYQPLRRVNEVQDGDHDRLIVWQMEFETMLEEAGTTDTGLTAKESVTLELDTELDIDNTTIRTGDGE
jgi:hypothetical protein